MNRVIEKEERYIERAKIIKAMAHPSRLQMIEELSFGEKCVMELQQIIGDDISTVSKHLALMKNAGILDSRKEGLNVYYRLKVPCIINFFSCVEAVVENEKKYCCENMEVDQ